MKKYVIRRILSGILTIFIVFTLTFILIKSAPGDPIRTLLGQDNDDPVLQCGGAHSMSQRGVYGKERDNAG